LQVPAHPNASIHGNKITDVSSVPEDGKVEVAEAFGIGDCLDLDDFSVCDAEAKHHEEAAAWGYDNTDCSVDECWLCCTSTAACCAVGYGGCAADLCRRVRRQGSGVVSKDGVWIEYCEKRLKVTAARGRQECVDDLSLTGEIGVGRCGRSLDTAARAAGELSCGSGGAVDDRGDLVKGEVEHIVQHEGEPFGRSECLEHDEQGETDRVGEKTRLSDRADPVPDEIWNEAARHYDEKALAALVIEIALINVWNRFNVTTRQVASAVAW
jgi:hypothetical protein